MIGLTSLCLLACSSPEIVKTEYRESTPPALIPCHRWTIQEFGAVTNGELWAYKIQLEKSLDECANQVDQQIIWQQTKFDTKQ